MPYSHHDHRTARVLSALEQFAYPDTLQVQETIHGEMIITADTWETRDLSDMRRVDRLAAAAGMETGYSEEYVQCDNCYKAIPVDLNIVGGGIVWAAEGAPVCPACEEEHAVDVLEHAAGRQHAGQDLPAYVNVDPLQHGYVAVTGWKDYHGHVPSATPETSGPNYSRAVILSGGYHEDYGRQAMTLYVQLDDDTGLPCLPEGYGLLLQADMWHLVADEPHELRDCHFAADAVRIAWEVATGAIELSDL